MATSNQQRHSMIGQAVRRLHGNDAGAAVDIELWESLARELSNIIGERGFASLFARSLHHAALSTPWLAPQPPQAGDPFALLAARLSAQPTVTAQAANIVLLNIFVDTLIVLIGELLTDSILRKAWGEDVVNQAGTEYRT